MSNEEETVVERFESASRQNGKGAARTAELEVDVEQVAEQTIADAQLAQLEKMVFENYVGFCQQVGAILTLTASMPLEPLLAACKRKQRVGILTLPQGTTPEQAVALGAQLRNDERIFTLMVELQRVYQQIATGRPA